ncbi:MAG: UDP-N-acetylmuramate--L-alanine ligase [Candidatus Moraniibacteriota bacterium]
MNNQILLSKAKNIYLVGIKGVGMTALAQILKSRGKKVTGSDTKEKFFTDGVLRKLRISFKEGFSDKNLSKNTDLVIYSTAFNAREHPEIIAAKRKKLPVISYPQALSTLFNSELGIAVSGTHGKTTTSALIAESLKNLGLDPTALIGSRVANWQTNAITGKSPFFVIEADEHQNKLKHYHPWSLVLTNIDYDHPDFYRKPEDYYQAFKKWVGEWQAKKSPVPKIGVFNGDDLKTKRLMRELKLNDGRNCIILTYGINKDCDFIIHLPSVPSLVRRGNKGEVFSKVNIEINIHNEKRRIIPIKTTLIGEHNAYNLAAAFAFVTGLNLITNKISEEELKSIPLNKIARSFATFRGTERRMQYIGRKGKVLVYDDYAHHPREIEAALLALRKNFLKHKIFVIFQPHTFTRTSAFLKEFVKSLKLADIIGLLPIYGSAREAKGKITSASIEQMLSENKKTVFNFPSHKDCLEFLRKYKFKNPTILITMGAGDGWRIGRSFLKF